MSRRRVHAGRTAAGVLFLAVALLGLRMRGEPKVLHRAAGVTIERVDEALVPHGDRIGARDGDLVLDNGEIQVVVGASSRGGRRQDYGAVLDVTGPGFTDDAVGSIRTVLTAGGRRVSLVTENVEAIQGRGAPFVRVTAAASGVAVVTDVVSRALEGIVELTSTVTNRTPRALDLRPGDDVDWPGVPTFAPGHGEVEDDGRMRLAWFARHGPLTYGLVFPGESADVEFRAKQSETDQTCWGPAAVLPAGGSTVYRRLLVATRGGLSQVARVAAARTGRPIGSAVGVLDPAPAWALITAIASDGTIAMREGAGDDGTFDLALPPGRHTLVLQTPGGWDETAVDVQTGPKPTPARLVAPQPERLDFRITDQAGKAIAGRMVVVGEAGTPDPRFASAAPVSAAGNEVHSVTGEGRVDIPAGRYRVVVSRGIEWSIAERTIEVKPEQGVSLRVALSRTLPTPGWIAADLHLHAAPSNDSELRLDDRVASLVAAGIEFAVATDHNHVTDYAPTAEALGVSSLLETVPGVEITTRTWGHFNAYPLPPKSAPPPHAGIDPPEIFAAVRRMAPTAVIQVNHPWRPGYGYFHRSALNEQTGTVWRKRFSFDFDLIEVVNGYELGSSDVVDKNLRRYFGLLNLGHRYTAVGSSDSHKLTNEWAGYPRTYVRVADDRPERVTVADVVSALRAGHATVSLGPFIEAHVGESGPGDTVSTVPGTVPLEVTVRSSPWVSVDRVDVVVNGEIFETFDVGEHGADGNVRWSELVDLPAQRDSWVVVVARGERPLDAVLPGRSVPPFAFTNPIWIDVGEPMLPKPARALARRRSPEESAAVEDAPDAAPAAYPEGEDEEAAELPEPRLGASGPGDDGGAP